MSLKIRLERLIAEEGPITVEVFMTLCLHDPEFGYYATRPALGEGGDFITAPLLSQMFGEMIGLWAVDTWDRMGRPDRFRLVEMGPGDGTLMSDALRAARVVPDFAKAADLWLVETSAPLRRLQAERLQAASPRWADALDEVPGGAPIILIANELLDCLPARQFVRTGQGWAERRIGLLDGALAFGLAPPPANFAPPFGLDAAPEGALVEVSSAQMALGAEVGARVGMDGGVALVIDYGRDRPEPGDTLQALKSHRKVDPLEAPGEADLTVHADFPAVAAAARAAGGETTTIVAQGDFLRALGIELRAQALMSASPAHAARSARQLHRLIAPDEMGALFKVLCIHARGMTPAGF